MNGCETCRRLPEPEALMIRLSSVLAGQADDGPEFCGWDCLAAYVAKMTRRAVAA